MPTTYAIPNGRTVMTALLYTGTGSANTAVTGTGFKPDLVWAKSRSNAQYNGLFDSVRSGYALYSNATDAEDTTEQVTFNTNGFTTPNKSADFINTSGYTYVGWQWQAGQGTTSSNTSGSITSTVSVNTTAGFSIVTYTGTGSAATVGHGLGVAPSMMIFKDRSSGVYNWAVWHTSLGGGDYALQLNTTAASTNAYDYWNGSPSSTTFGIGTDFGTNKSGDAYVAYCWAQVAGFSQFGSYTGNGSDNGPFVYTGFRPSFVLIKNITNGTTYWEIYDNARNTYNVESNRLYPNAASAESTGQTTFDFLSNGLKVRSGGNTDANESGSTIIYAAFAENPFKYANAR